MKHPHMFLIWACYLGGLVLHVLLAAADTVQDPTSSINTYRQYFRKYAIVIAARFFVLICLFPAIWDNPSTFDIEGVMKTTGMQIGASGVIGFFCDSVAGRALNALGITAKLPTLPDPGQPTVVPKK